MKSIPAINPEIMECSIVKVHVPAVNPNSGKLLDHSVSLRFVY